MNTLLTKTPVLPAEQSKAHRQGLKQLQREANNAVNQRRDDEKEALERNKQARVAEAKHNAKVKLEKAKKDEEAELKEIADKWKASRQVIIEKRRTDIEEITGSIKDAKRLVSVKAALTKSVVDKHKYDGGVQQALGAYGLEREERKRIRQEKLRLKAQKAAEKAEGGSEDRSLSVEERELRDNGDSEDLSHTAAADEQELKEQELKEHKGERKRKHKHTAAPPVKVEYPSYETVEAERVAAASRPRLKPKVKSKSKNPKDSMDLTEDEEPRR